MYKDTKLGIPDSLLIAVIFLSGLVDSAVMVGLAIYVLLAEKDQRVKTAAKKALILFGLVAILIGGLETLDHVVRLLLRDEGFYSGAYANIIHVIYLLRNVCYLAMGLTEAVAFISYIKGSGVNSAFMVHEETPAPAPVPAAAQPAANVCPKCGTAVDPGVHFCKKCGTKTTQ